MLDVHTYSMGGGGGWGGLGLLSSLHWRNKEIMFVLVSFIVSDTGCLGNGTHTAVHLLKML